MPGTHHPASRPAPPAEQLDRARLTVARRENDRPGAFSGTKGELQGVGSRSSGQSPNLGRRSYLIDGLKNRFDRQLSGLDFVLLGMNPSTSTIYSSQVYLDKV